MWYKKLGHVSLRLISKLKKHNLVRRLPSIVYKIDLKGNKLEDLSNPKNVVSTFKALDMLHINLFGPTRIASMSEKQQDILHNFSCPRMPRQNDVVEKKNKSLQEMARAMLNDFNSPKLLMNCGRIDNPTHMNTKDNLGKFDPKSDKGTFLGYSTMSKAYEVYNSRTLTVEESIHMKTYHAEQQILGNIQDRVITRSTFKGQAQVVMLFEVDPNNIEDSIFDEGWIKVMQEELDQF
ncbi:hypothetical protein CR513_47095, partial [Mucuna pruriens]